MLIRAGVHTQSAAGLIIRLLNDGCCFNYRAASAERDRMMIMNGLLCKDLEAIVCFKVLSNICLETLRKMINPVMIASNKARHLLLLLLLLWCYYYYHHYNYISVKRAHSINLSLYTGCTVIVQVANKPVCQCYCCS
jgi:hypothetical protein